MCDSGDGQGLGVSDNGRAHEATRFTDTFQPFLLPPTLQGPPAFSAQNAHKELLVQTLAKKCQTSQSWVQNDLKADAALDASLGAIDAEHVSKPDEGKKQIRGEERKERNSLDSLEELEKLIEEQHKELVSRGILPPDDIDLGLHSELEPFSRTRHLNEDFLQLPQSPSVRLGGKQDRPGDCLSEIDDLEKRAEASKRISLPEESIIAPCCKEVITSRSPASHPLQYDLHGKFSSSNLAPS